jgi:two-component system, NarL family, invasion response regulator UvrY
MPTTISPTQPSKILLIDPCEIYLEGLSHLLGTHLSGCTLGTASSFDAAISSAYDNDWDLAIVEPDINKRLSLDILQELRIIRPQMRQLVCSTMTETEAGVRSIKCGAAGYVEKSAGFARLLDAASNLLAGKSHISYDLASMLISHVRNDGQIAPHDTLTNREFRVLRLLATGDPLKAIASEMNLSAKTIASCRLKIFIALGLDNTADMVEYCLRHSIQAG